MATTKWILDNPLGAEMKIEMVFKMAHAITIN